MFELITQSEADRIKQILNEARLKEDINIEVLDGKYKINAFNIIINVFSKNSFRILYIFCIT